MKDYRNQTRESFVETFGTTQLQLWILHHKLILIKFSLSNLHKLTHTESKFTKFLNNIEKVMGF